MLNELTQKLRLISGADTYVENFIHSKEQSTQKAAFTASH